MTRDTANMCHMFLSGGRGCLRFNFVVMLALGTALSTLNSGNFFPAVVAAVSTATGAARTSDDSANRTVYISNNAATVTAANNDPADLPAASTTGKSGVPSSPTVDHRLTLHLVPHSHCDVGWLQTVDSLSRMNVSRILNGVVGNLANDTKRRRRFIWDEMAFLQLWWEKQATVQQKQDFKQLVSEGRIEFVDNGWSQHDMGCTTLDSMLSNWVEGHEWLRTTFGASARPKVGWSIDPFGQSGTQAVLQALMGMEAWFFTRLPTPVIQRMKDNKSVEFVWRASSSLSARQSEIFVHVLESYYCMPLPTYAFEWGPGKGAKVPDASNILELALGLAKIAKQRAAWFRTPNVLIPWGCDYQYQNAELVYRSTDWLIDTINAHPEWGVDARYSTTTEYLDAVASAAAASNASPANNNNNNNPRTANAVNTAAEANSRHRRRLRSSNIYNVSDNYSNNNNEIKNNKNNKNNDTSVRFPVKPTGETFFPFNDWSGYFTSRPRLKGLSTRAHAAMHSAESLMALRPASDAQRSTAWKLLETARRGAAIFQHHDAITGTFCVAEDGCSGTDQVVGTHDVQGDYQHMLDASIAASMAAASGILSETIGNGVELASDLTSLGRILMGSGGDGGDKGLLVVYNPHARPLNATISLQVPVCALAVRDAHTGGSVLAQVTEMATINDGVAPYYDFLLFFEAKLPALGYRAFVVDPAVDASCNGGDDMLHHRHNSQPMPSRGQSDKSSPYYRPKALPAQGAAAAAAATFSRHEVIFDTRRRRRHHHRDRDNNGVQPQGQQAPAINAKNDNGNTASTLAHLDALAPHERALVEEQAAMVCTGKDRSAGTDTTTTTATTTDAICQALAAASSFDGEGTVSKPPPSPPPPVVLENAHIRVYVDPQTGLEAVYDKALQRNISLRYDLIGYNATDNNAYSFTPAGPASRLVSSGQKFRAATATYGPVVQEVRLQVTDEHRTRIRIWVTKDPDVGRRLEIGNRIAVLAEMTDIAARISAPAVHPNSLHPDYDTRAGVNACAQRCTLPIDPLRLDSAKQCEARCNSVSTFSKHTEGGAKSESESESGASKCRVYVYFSANTADERWRNVCMLLSTAAAADFGRTSPASWTPETGVTSGLRLPSGLFFSEDNGYETIPHIPGFTNHDQPSGGIAENHYPSQVSAFLRTGNKTVRARNSNHNSATTTISSGSSSGSGSSRGRGRNNGHGRAGSSSSSSSSSSSPDSPGAAAVDGLQLSVALDRSHAVASLADGQLDVVLHRRGGPFAGTGGTVVLDDVDRVSPELWLSVGEAMLDNRRRHQNKALLNRPPQLFFGAAPISLLKPDVTAAQGYKAGLPDNLSLQAARATQSDAGEALLRLRHLYSTADAALDPHLAAPVKVDLAALLRALGLRTPNGNVTETTVDGMLPVAGLTRRRFPTVDELELDGIPEGKQEGTDKGRPRRTRRRRDQVHPDESDKFMGQQDGERYGASKQPKKHLGQEQEPSTLPPLIVNPFELRTFRAGMSN